MVKALEDIMLQFAAEVGDVSLSASVQEMGLISGVEDCELTLCVLWMVMLQVIKLSAWYFLSFVSTGLGFVNNIQYITNLCLGGCRVP